MIYQGSCHCGRIAYEVEGELGPVIECNCSHCSRKGYLLWFLPREKLQLTTPEGDMATYLFNKHVLEHKFCPDCGTTTFAFGDSPSGDRTVAINVRCLEGVDLTAIERKPYDGRSK